MIERDITLMSIGEVRRLKAVQSSIGGQVTQKTVAAILGLSERQVRRLVRDVRERGDRGIIHALRGRQSNRRLSEEVRGRVLSLYQARYPDFGPTLATEKLLKCEGIKISDETLRKWLIEEEFWKKRRKRSGFRQWRQRKACFGQMVQRGGSLIMKGPCRRWIVSRGM